MPPDPLLSVKLTIDLFSGHAENLLAMVAVLDPQAGKTEDTLHLWLNTAVASAKSSVWTSPARSS